MFSTDRESFGETWPYWLAFFLIVPGVVLIVYGQPLVGWVLTILGVGSFVLGIVRSHNQPL